MFCLSSLASKHCPLHWAFPVIRYYCSYAVNIILKAYEKDIEPECKLHEGRDQISLVLYLLDLVQASQVAETQ